MKKILVLVVLIAIPALFVLMNNQDIPDVEVDTGDNFQTIKKTDFELTSKKEKNQIIEKFNEVLKKDTQVEIYPQALEFSKKQVKCILEKTCTEDPSSEFYDPKLDPANTILRKSLEVINRISLMDSEKLDLIEDDHLLDVLKVGHTSSSFLAYTILLRKGKDSFMKTVEGAKNFAEDDAINYLRQYKNVVLSEDENFRQVRDDLIDHYLRSGNGYTVQEVLKEVQKHKLSDAKIADIVEITCNQLVELKTESQKMTKVQLKKLAKSINMSSVCQ